MSLIATCCSSNTTPSGPVTCLIANFICTSGTLNGAAICATGSGSCNPAICCSDSISNTPVTCGAVNFVCGTSGTLNSAANCASSDPKSCTSTTCCTSAPSGATFPTYSAATCPAGRGNLGSSVVCAVSGACTVDDSCGAPCISGAQCITTASAGGINGCSPGQWQTGPASAFAGCRPATTFGAAFGVSGTIGKADASISIISAIDGSDGFLKHASVALMNAKMTAAAKAVDPNAALYPYTEDEVKTLVKSKVACMQTGDANACNTKVKGCVASNAQACFDWYGTVGDHCNILKSDFTNKLFTCPTF